MSVIVAVYLIGLLTGTAANLGATLSDATYKTPRQTLSRWLRRQGYAFTWPVSVPVRIVIAVIRDEW